MEVYTVNLEEGMPYVDEALEHLEKSLRRAKNGGCKVVKFIHGYGLLRQGGKDPPGGAVGAGAKVGAGGAGPGGAGGALLPL